MGGEVRSATPGVVGSAANAESVPESLAVAEVTQLTALLKMTEVQPEGKDGAVTESKLSAKGETGFPIGKVVVSAPRLAVPSCSSRVVVSVPPQEALAVNVNGCVTVAPPPLRAP